MAPWVMRTGLAMAFLSSGSAPWLQADPSSASGPTVSVTESKGLYYVLARLWVPVPPAAVWSVLTDYDHIAEFIHDIQASRLVERRADVCIVEQRGRGILGIVLRVRLQVVERPLDEIQFEALDGDFRVYRGSFRLEAQGEGTEVTYVLESQGKFWIPSWLGRPLIRGRVRRILEDIETEVRRRQAGVSGRGVLDAREVVDDGVGDPEFRRRRVRRDPTRVLDLPGPSRLLPDPSAGGHAG